MGLHGGKQGYAANVVSIFHPTKNVNISNLKIVPVLLMIHLFPYMINPLKDCNMGEDEHYP